MLMRQLSTIRVINLAVRFLLEIETLVAFTVWGATLRASATVRIVAAVVLPVALALFWGLFVSPKARFSTGVPGQAGLGLLVFLIGAWAVRDLGYAGAATALALVAVLSSLVLVLLSARS